MLETKIVEAMPGSVLAHLGQGVCIAVCAGLLVGAGVQERAPAQGGFARPPEGESVDSWTQHWLEGPVQYITTEKERRLYESLDNAQERLQFIRLFWQRRDPRIRGPINEFLQEFGRRVVYANEHFGNGKPGWQTVFGRIVLVLGPPDRTRRELVSFPVGFSDRPPILWSYDRFIPEFPANEDLLFVHRTGKWRLMPPAPVGDSGVAAQRRQLERLQTIAEIPTDFRLAMRSLVEETLIHPVDYQSVINPVRVAVAFPQAQIPFAWKASFGSVERGSTDVELRLTWHMESLIFHVVDERFQTEMVVRAVLLSEQGVTVAETSENVSVQVPLNELQRRGGEEVVRSIHLQAPAGHYTLELTLEDQVLGYRTLYRDTLEVPGS
ncbi:MAG: GWxTD domain-containing protein [Acidobacteriota bacterium]